MAMVNWACQKARKKPMLRPIFILGVALTLVPACVVAQDPVIKIVTRKSFWEGPVYVSTEYMTATALRTEYIRDDHHFATIVLHRDTMDQTFITLDLDAHDYIVTKPRGPIAGPTRVPVKDTGSTLDIWIESTDTGERKEMFGHTARHVVTKEDTFPVQEHVFLLGR